MASAGLHPVRAWVRIPDGLADDPEAFAEFIDYRLLVRLATAENQALTIGEHGILHHPALTRLPYRGDFLAGVLAACNEIEQNGATAARHDRQPVRLVVHDARQGHPRPSWPRTAR